MKIFTVTVLDQGNIISTHRGWYFSRSPKSGLDEFNVPDLDGKSTFFNIQSLQPGSDGLVNDGYYMRQFSALARDKYPETNNHSVLIALASDGYLDIPEHYYKKHMIKSAMLRNGSLVMAVVHMSKNQQMSFCIRDGNRIVRTLTLRYNHDHHMVEVYDHSQELVMSGDTPSDAELLRPIFRLLRFLKSFVSRPDPRTVR